MADDIYNRLARHLDDLPGGFPPTQSGVELRILKRLFSPQEAELALHTTLIPETAAVIARRAKLTPDKAEERLDEMGKKGLIFSIRLPSKPALYMAFQYVIGIWEYQVNNLDEGLIQDMNEYIPTLFNLDTWKRSPQLRTIPVEKSVDARLHVTSHEAAEEMVRGQKKILVVPCICRREHAMVGKGCDKPEESCLVFGTGAYYYEKRGIGRKIDEEECLEILKRADKAGLVLQPNNAKKLTNICCCCGCCCQVLKNIARHPTPADIVSSPFMAQYDPQDCTGCGVCVDRCQMRAISNAADVVALDASRCIGCGLCVSTCPTNALTLIRKPDEQQAPVPATPMESFLQLARARGKLGRGTLMRMSLRSKWDRMLAK